MSTPIDSQASPPRSEAAGYRLIGVWTVCLIAILAAVVYISVSTVDRYRQQANEHHRAMLAAGQPDSGTVQPDTATTSGTPPSDVRVGLYINRVVDLSVSDDKWTVDFYIWFRWTDAALQPGETFEVLQGKILSRERQDEYQSGDDHYAAYRVIAEISKFYDVTRFPLDDHMLTIEIEDDALTRSQLRYVADPDESSLSADVHIPGYAIREAGCVVKVHSYPTTFGDPRLPDGASTDYSMFRYGIWLDRDDWRMALKVFLGLTAAVFVSLVAFFIRPSAMDARFSVRVGAFFGAIAAAIASAGLIPDTSVLTLTDMLTGLALVVILLTLVEATVSMHMYHTRGESSLVPLLDRVSLPILAIAYFGGGAALLLAAHQ